MFQNQVGMNPYMAGMPSMNTGITWVENIQQAEQFELPPGCDVALFNKNKDELYIRSRDRYNIYSTRIYELKEITPVKPESQYVTRNELEEIFQKFLGGGNNVALQSVNGAAAANASDSTGSADQSAGGGKRKTDGTDAAVLK